MNKYLPRLKKTCFIMKKQEQEGHLSPKINKSSDYWQDFKFQRYWFKLEQISPMKRYTKKNPFLTVNADSVFKENIKDYQWV